MTVALAAAVTWETIDDLIASRWNGRPELRGKGCATYLIPSPTGGTIQVFIDLNRRWCEIDVDCFRTTCRAAEPSKAWFQTYTWPLVASTCKQARMNGFPAERRGSYAGAYPLDRSAIPEVFTAWIDRELIWGLPPEEPSSS